MTQTPDPKVTAKTPRTIKLVLVASLALNLLVLGAVSGAVLSGKGSKDQRVQMSHGLTPYVRALDKEQRRALGGEFRSKGGKFRVSRDDVRTAYAPVLTLLRAENFDAVAFQAAMDAQSNAFRDQNRSRDTAGRAGLVKVVGSMSTQERAAFAQALSEALERGPKGKKGGGRD